MKKLTLHALSILLLCAMPVLAQEHYTEGPVWQVSLIRVKPTQMDAYLTSLRERSKPLLEEQKRQGMIMDYKWFLNQTKHGQQDWDMALAVEYKNFAALDGLTAKSEAVRDKILGSKQAAQQLGEKRQEIREIVEIMLMREVTLK
jgi:competence protein ComGC